MLSQPPVGIDLGTTYSALAVINAAGKPEIVPNADGDRITASAVYFEEGGKVIIGADALSAWKAYPERVARFFKREMGNADYRFKVDGREYSAVDLSALVLKKLKQDAEQTLGPIQHAVVTVPAYFDEPRRKATMDAARIAGLDVLRIINEPTAAALAYSSGGGKTGRILVYDFGGGTFDVSIVDVSHRYHAEVFTSEGDHELGGYDLDKRLRDYFVAHFKQQKGINASEDQAALHKFQHQAEQDKRSLSKREKVSTVLAWKGHEVVLDVTRIQFEELIADELIRTEMLVDNALANKDLKPAEINEVLLVGGSSRIPAVIKMLEKKFGKLPVAPLNVDEAVALGAAIQAGVIMQEKGLTKLPPAAANVMSATVCKDVASHAYGTIAVELVHGVERTRNSIIIPKDTRVPAARTETYYTMGPNQTIIRCRVTQASNNQETDPEFVSTLGDWEMELPPGRRAQCPIKITFEYDSNQRMKCSFHDVESGHKEEKTFDMRNGLARASSQQLDDLASDLSDLVIE